MSIFVLTLHNPIVEGGSVLDWRTQGKHCNLEEECNSETKLSHTLEPINWDQTYCWPSDQADGGTHFQLLGRSQGAMPNCNHCHSFPQLELIPTCGSSSPTRLPLLISWINSYWRRRFKGVGLGTLETSARWEGSAVPINLNAPCILISRFPLGIRFLQSRGNEGHLGDQGIGVYRLKSPPVNMAVQI